MLARDFDFHLPSELIAQMPASPRDSSRLMRLNCADEATSHHIFRDLPDLLRPDDLLVFNDTRVLRARLRGAKMLPDRSYGARIEALLLSERGSNVWECLLKPSSRLRVGTTIRFASHDNSIFVDATTIERRDESWTIRFHCDDDVRALLESLGEIPLPPYIGSRASDDNDYQTVYARTSTRTESNGDLNEKSAPESAAAPTAGLHFTPQLMQELETRGIETAFVTLGIGVGTFRPMKTEHIEEHTMHEECYEVSAVAAQKINAQRARGKRVVAIGTTTTRVLESCCDDRSVVQSGFGATSIFIRPGKTFHVVDALVTNFHLPQSTLLVMISALAQHIQQREKRDEPSARFETSSGLSTVLNAYEEAVRKRYRFFSFGDAMLIE